jgi:uncharacterized oxidoreductase
MIREVMMAAIRLFPVEGLRAAMNEFMRGFGSSPAEVDLVTENLLQANLTGHDSHGVGMLPRYAEAFLEGGLRPNAHVEIRLDHGAVLTLDGQNGFGQTVGHEAMEIGIARVRLHGSCIVALARSHHLGRIGAWAEMAVAAGLVSIHFVNVISQPIVAPWGGRDARFGTNPFAVGIPVAAGDPIVLDFATSIIAQGKTRVAHNKGEALQPGNMLDDRGVPTTNPKFGVVKPFGALLTFGQHKGFGLSLVCELLGGALAGALAVHEPARGERRVINGMLTILFDPQLLAERATFQREMQACLDWIKASPPQAGFERVQVAGEPERAMRIQRTAEGIPIDETTWGEILTAAAKLGIDPSKLNRHVGA